jgi:CxxC-x17-CxxC domain-containing protein
MYQDETLKCRDCGEDFVFTAREQEFFAEKGFTNKPVRCKNCRNARKGERYDGGGRRPQREMFDAVCAECGAATQVPFQPKNDRPVYCSTCFTRNRDR